MLTYLKLTHTKKALVLGDGFEGQLFAQILKARGIHEVTLAGRSDEKLETTGSTSALRLSTLLREEIPADAYDIVVEAVGLPATQEQALAAAARGAQVLMFGVGNPDDKFSKHLRRIPKATYNSKGPSLTLTLLKTQLLLSSGVVDPLPLFSHELDLDGVEDFVSGKLGKVSKAVVKVGGEEA